jgi:Tol biopolymer transport system component
MVGLCLSLLTACTVQVANQGTGSSNNRPTPMLTATWTNLYLGGKLILIQYVSGGVNLTLLDMNSGQIVPVFHVLAGASLGAAIISPDGKQLLLSYAPPPADARQNPGLSLFLLPIDGKGTPQPVFSNPAPGEDYFNPIWSLDGKWIYATHLVHGEAGSNTSDRYSIVKISLDGQTQKIAADAIWPSLSPDGKYISYVSAAPGSTPNELYLANIDGTNPRPLTSIDLFLAVDDHFFTPDSKSLIFSAVNPGQSTPTPKLLDQLLGVITASAHGVPSDWYQIPVSGNKPPVRLTNLGDTGMYAHLSPDGKYIAFIAQTGLYSMALDGSNLTYLSPLVFGGTLDWMP